MRFSQRRYGMDEMGRLGGAQPARPLQLLEKQRERLQTAFDTLNEPHLK
jgi:hypothetical protein